MLTDGEKLIRDLKKYMKDNLIADDHYITVERRQTIHDAIDLIQYLEELHVE